MSHKGHKKLPKKLEKYRIHIRTHFDGVGFGNIESALANSSSDVRLAAITLAVNEQINLLLTLDNNGCLKQEEILL